MLERFHELGASGKGGPEPRWSLLCSSCMASEQPFCQPLAWNTVPDLDGAKGGGVQRLSRGRGPGPGLPGWPCSLPQLPGLLLSDYLSSAEVFLLARASPLVTLSGVSGRTMCPLSLHS